MPVHDIVIIGAGMAGIACARHLADAGVPAVVLDKGRGIGGRLATRRAEPSLQFDHGAQYVTAKGDAFRKALERLQAEGAAGKWDLGDRQPFVGTPGMNALAKGLAAGIDVRQRTEVRSVRRAQTGWQVAAGDEVIPAARVVMTVPAPQAIALLGPDHSLARQIGSVRLHPCLTLMAALAPDQPRPFVHRRDPEDPIAWIAQNNTKPGRSEATCWVAQAGPAFSAEHLERDKDEIAATMLPMLCDRLGADPSSALYAAGHRWRYSAVDRALGQDFAHSEDGTLFLGGDWCIGARVEAAWTSGTAIAKALLAAQ